MKLKRAIGRLIDALEDLEYEFDAGGYTEDRADAWDELFDAAIEVRAAQEDEDLE